MLRALQYVQYRQGANKFNIKRIESVPDAVLGQRVRQLDLPDLHLVHVEIYTRKI
jgi:hypothetical protein